MRPTRKRYFMDIAKLTAKRSTCRVKVGAVAVKNRRIIMSAYNGSPSGMKHCTEVGCLFIDGHCKRTVHAEMNLITMCAKEGISLRDATVYCTHEPCNECKKNLISAGVKAVVYKENYNDYYVFNELKEHIILERFEDETKTTL